jgi:hypothetical protein
VARDGLVNAESVPVVETDNYVLMDDIERRQNRQNVKNSGEDMGGDGFIEGSKVIVAGGFAKEAVKSEEYPPVRAFV